jgi:hypothetical protein
MEGTSGGMWKVAVEMDSRAIGSIVSIFRKGPTTCDWARMLEIEFG